MISSKEDIVKTEEKDNELTDALPEISLEQLSKEMREACNRAGWKTLTPVQAKFIPCLGRRDESGNRMHADLWRLHKTAPLKVKEISTS